MARIVSSEPERDVVPPGEGYVVHFQGFVPRDKETGEPRFIEIDEYGSNNQKTGEKEDAVLWQFGVLAPEEWQGWTVTGLTRWKGLRVVSGEDKLNVIQVDRIGSMIAYLVKWAEICGVDWEADLVGLPDEGRISNDMLVQALEAALLKHAKEGIKVVVKVGDRGYVRGSDPVMPLAVGSALAKRAEGMKGEFPDWYKAAGGREIPWEFSEGQADEWRAALRGDLAEALTSGDSILTWEAAKENNWVMEAMRLGGERLIERVKAFSELMAANGYDAVDTSLLVRLTSMASGAPLKQKMLDSLSEMQLKAAYDGMSYLAGALEAAGSLSGEGSEEL